MKSKIGVAAVIGLLATVLSAAPASAQCNPIQDLPGVMINFDNAWAYETDYSIANSNSAAGSQLTVVGIVSVFCTPFSDLNPLDPGTEYTFIWDGLVSQGTVTTLIGSLGAARYVTQYVGGNFRIYAGSPRNAPTAGTLPPLPAPGVVPAAFVDGTMILSGTMAPLTVTISRTSGGTYSGAYRANYLCTGGTLYSRVSEVGEGLMAAGWCPVPPNTNPCQLPAGWSAQPFGKWDMPVVSALPSTWGKIKTLYR
ncbi:MAG: hypothetical protein E4H17_02175 [Gemmatimonadales bacterium]|nr:MAG: hypothetical protein E4H17_02175 [Gemmatimonadales bacterium]